jgi:hypothetical protein
MLAGRCSRELSGRKLQKVTVAENLRGGLEREICRCLEATPDIRQDDSKGVGKALADSRGLSSQTVCSLTGSFLSQDRLANAD